MAKAGKGMGHGTTIGHDHVGPEDPDTAPDLDDLTTDVKGMSRHGDDESGRGYDRSQRHDVPDVKTTTEGVIESFENLDPATRAERERSS